MKNIHKIIDRLNRSLGFSSNHNIKTVDKDLVANSVRNRMTYLNYPPNHVWIEPTNICNYRCVKCPHSLGLKRKQGYMSMKLFRKIVDDLASLIQGRFVSLHFGGESLLHPRLVDMVAYCEDNGIHTNFFTNGSLLTRDLFSKLLDAGLSRMAVSIDEYDKEKYEHKLKGGNFDIVVRNIRSIIDEIEKRNASTQIGLNVVTTDDKEFEIKAFGLRSLFPSESLEIFNNLQHSWAGEIGNSKEYMSNKKNDSISNNPCPFIYQAMVVCWDGNVCPCTRDIEGSIIVGDANKQMMSEIWNSDDFRTLREAQISRNRDTLPSACRRCDLLYTDGLY